MRDSVILLRKILEMKPINVGLLGIGTVGGGTWTVLKRNADEITRRAGRPIRITRVPTKMLNWRSKSPVALLASPTMLSPWSMIRRSTSSSN